MRYAIIGLLIGLLLFGCTNQSANNGGSNQLPTTGIANVPPQTAPPSQPQPTSPQTSPSQGSTSPPGGQTNNPSAVKFSDSQYANYATQIFPGQLSDAANRAMTGFTMNTTTQANGTTDVTLTQTASGVVTDVMVPPGYSLYFIETSYGDDPPGYDTSLGDDGIVLVDPNGYISQ